MNEEGMKRWRKWQQGWSVLWVKEGPDTGDPTVLVQMVGGLLTRSQGFKWIATNGAVGAVYHLVWLGGMLNRSAEGPTRFVADQPIGGAVCGS